MQTGDAAVLGDFSAGPRTLRLVGLAVAAGLAGAAGASVLLWLIAAITNLAFYGRWSAAAASPAGHGLGPAVIFIPVAGSLVIGLMARYGSEKIRGHGIPEAMEAILLGGSRMEAKVAVLKPLSSAISIGTGGPFGAEGPIIMTGGACGSLLGQAFHLSGAERKTLLAAGAAGGMAAVFSTPMAAVLLAVELLLFEWKPRSLLPVAAAVLTAWLARCAWLGEGALFPVRAHAAPGAAEVLGALGLGLGAGCVSGGLTRAVYAAEDAFERLPVHWMWWPAAGAVVVGLGGWLEPRALGVGYDLIGRLLRGEDVPTLGWLLLVKAAVWVVALGSGTSGGVLAPLLILGGGLGALSAGLLPGGDASLWAMAGMAAMMGGAMRSPLTAVLFAVELTRDVASLPALAAAAFAAHGATVLLMRRSILTEKLARRGRHVVREYSVDSFEVLRVADVMEATAPCAPESLAARTLAEQMDAPVGELAGRRAVLLTDDEGRLRGIVTRRDLARLLAVPGNADAPAGAASPPQIARATPEETLASAWRRMLDCDVGRLAVVAREDSGRIVGYLGRRSLLEARRRALAEEHGLERGFGKAAARTPARRAPLTEALACRAAAE